MFCLQRVGNGHIQFGFRSQIGFEFFQGRIADDCLGARRIAFQLEMSATRRLAQTVCLLDDAEQQWSPA